MAEIKKGKTPKAVYITSANFYKDGKEFITKMNTSKFKSAELNCGYERESLMELLDKKGFKDEIKIIKRFYTRNGKEGLDDNGAEE
ncbi:hypothetical protein [Desertivirga xinjiangensis]|uniref:hypothetical protein n=1 Tax=Desertivirga xinjiangensis TaxID=539206 RepID=UPI00210ED0F0|nr:hypothetical protein [Pedobacter xinjiangensis]